MIKLEV